MCDHVLACAHLCRRPFVTICCVGVSAERLVLQHSIWGYSICWHTHTHVHYRKQEFVVAVSVCRACVCFFERASTCAANKAINHPLSRVP